MSSVAPFEWESTYIFNQYASVPTYHDYRGIRNDADVTRCGLVMYAGGNRNCISLPLGHSKKFARPCRRCFPVAAGGRVGGDEPA